MKPVFDTNILIDHLRGLQSAKREIERYHTLFISVITWIEIMAGAKNAEIEQELREFLKFFQVLTITPSTRELAASLRRLKGIKLPDAIIWATALEHDALLITRNTKDFPKEHPGIHIPYQL